VSRGEHERQLAERDTRIRHLEQQLQLQRQGARSSKSAEREDGSEEGEELSPKTAAGQAALKRIEQMRHGRKDDEDDAAGAGAGVSAA
jgi:hypothetical protein